MNCWVRCLSDCIISHYFVSCFLDRYQSLSVVSIDWWELCKLLTCTCWRSFLIYRLIYGLTIRQRRRLWSDVIWLQMLNFNVGASTIRIHLYPYSGYIIQPSLNLYGRQGSLLITLNTQPWTKHFHSKSTQQNNGKAFFIIDLYFRCIHVLTRTVFMCAKKIAISHFKAFMQTIYSDHRSWEYVYR